MLMGIRRMLTKPPKPQADFVEFVLKLGRPRAQKRSILAYPARRPLGACSTEGREAVRAAGLSQVLGCLYGE